MSMIPHVQALIDRSMASARRMAARTILQLIDDHYGVTLKGVHEETLRKAELWQHYGFTSRPLADAECCAIAMGGDGSHVILVAENDRRYRLALEGGEVALYDYQGNFIRIRKDQTIEINAVTSVYVTSPLVEIGEKDLAADRGIVTKAELQTACDDLKTAADAKFGACQPGSGVGPMDSVTATASTVGKCKA